MPLFRFYKKSFTLFSVFSYFLILNIGLSGVAVAGTTSPFTTHTLTPDVPNGNNGWYTTNVQVRLQSTDLESGVAQIRYRLNGGAWQTASFSNTANLAPNPSFETSGATTTGLASWEATVVDPEGTYIQGSSSAPGFPNRSARIDATAGFWHGINHKEEYALAAPFTNMTASVWLRTQDVLANAHFKVYAVTQDLDDPSILISHLISQSPELTGSNGWTFVSMPFTVNVADAIGVYLDIGLVGPGTVWADAATINSSSNVSQVVFNVGSDNANHVIEYYAVDNTGNEEVYDCTADPIKGCIEIKIDQTPPGNWRSSGAFRQIPGPSNHHLFVHATVDGGVSGLSTNSNIYQYRPDNKPTFGSASDLMQCNSTWNTDAWVPLLEGVTADGESTAYLQTQHTDFCNSVWRNCKYVRFYAEDMAGNVSIRDLCINGPWIRLRGWGAVRVNSNIGMISEPEGENTDGLIQLSGNTIDFFTSERNWVVRNSPNLGKFSYEHMSSILPDKTAITTVLPTTSGVYITPEATSTFILNNTSVPNNYNTATFNQIIFVPGNLRINRDVTISNSSTVLFIVGGNVEVERNVDDVYVAIITDGTFFSAYNLGINQTASTLNLRGFYVADRFRFQRTLQGTNNETFPTENFVYEPKYLVQLKQFFTGGSVQWR